MKNKIIEKEKEKEMKNIKIKNIKKEEKGITLIALVITIIVLLILAAVSIATLTGDNGILTKAQDASDATIVAEIEEEIRLWEMEKTIYDLTGEGTPLSEEDFINSLISNGLITEEDYDSTDGKITINGVEIELNSSTETGSGDSTTGNTSGEWDSVAKVNSPELAEGMIPIVYDETSGNWEVADTSTNWYSYTVQEGATTTGGTSMWANVMLSDGTLQASENPAVGTEIDTDNGDILGSMFVWIPRYSYMISSTNYHTSTAGTIEIKFLKDDTDEASDGTTTWDNASGGDNWNVHPAFKFGDEELSGFWMAKFEASGSTTELAFIPNVASLRSTTISVIFSAALTINDSENSYGISDTEVDSHMTLNSEWGAVAYLAQSSYGRNGTEVTINNSSDFITGNAGDTVSASYASGTTNEYSTTAGGLASTTGNIYGVYDMSGGANEYVPAYYSGTTSSYLTAMKTAAGEDYAKYMEEYPTSYSDSNSYYGDAIYETSSGVSSPYTNSWNSDYSYFVYSDAPFFRRGGSYYYGSGAGLFSFNNSNGNANSAYSFRVALSL